MNLVVFSHKVCWHSKDSPSGYATDGGFPLQMRALSELFDHIRIVVPVKWEDALDGEMDLTGRNLTVVPLPMLPENKYFRRLCLPFWFLWNLPKMLREIIRADAVHTPIPGDVGTFGMMIAFFLRKRLFVRHCGNWLRPATSAEYFWKWFMEKSAGGKNVMLATGGSENPPSRRNTHIQWIFATTLTSAELQETRTPRTVSRDRLTLVTVSRQEKEKGTNVVIDALPLIMEKFDQVELHIAGDGSFLPHLKQQANELGLNENVKFHGRLTHVEVMQLLSQCHVFCYPTSSSEGFPKVVLEALACGLPVVTTPVSVLPLLLRTQCGVILEETTAASLAEAVIRICSNRERYTRLSLEARNNARKYSLESWAAAIRDVLQRQWGRLHGEKNEPPLIDFNKLKVCFIAGTLGVGGAERQLFYIARHLHERGCDVHILSLTHGEFWESKLKSLGVRVVWVGQSKSRLLRAIRILRHIRKQRPDIIQSQHFYTNLYAVFSARWLGIPEVCAIRNNVITELNAAGMNRMLRRASLFMPRMLAANSRAAVSQAIREGLQPRRLHFLPNVVDTEHFNGSRKKAVLPITVLAVSRLVPEKRVDRFLRIMHEVKKRGHSIKGVVVGDGPERKRLEDEADKLNLLPDIISFPGFLEDMREVYREAHVVMLTSEYEGTPNVILEAMASSLAVVTFNVGGVPELIQDGETGFLLPNGDETSAVEVLCNLLSEPSRICETGIRARESIVKRHSSTTLGDSLQALYETALANA